MRAGSRVLLCTTTHMFPRRRRAMGRVESSPGRCTLEARCLTAPGCTCEACAGMSRGSICQAGVLDPQTGKLSSPAEPLDQLAQRFDYVLAEADGSKRLPLKAHAAWEPVIPSGTANVVWLVGASGSASPSRSRPPPRALLRALRLRVHRRRHARARRPGAQGRDAGA